MSDQYYIRVRGEVKGPLRREQIVAQIRRKRLGRHHELSTDAVTWQKAGEIADLFEPQISSRERLAEPVQAAAVDRATGHSEAEAEPETSRGGGEWYYSKGGNKLGPVSASDIQMWLSSGRLKISDLVWHEDFDNWLPAGDLPQFAAAAGANGFKSSQFGEQRSAGFWEVVLGTSTAAVLPLDAIHKYPNLTRYLQIAEGSLRILFVVALVLNFVGWLIVAAGATRLNEWGMVAGSIGAALGQALLTWLIFLSLMAGLELIRVIVKIEDNTSR